MTLGGRFSIQRGVSRQARRQELDREQWADLDRVHFSFIAEGFGEAYAGPYLFGRAFDTPPLFTYSSVCDQSVPITVGVADWIQDDQGMYVGANLWLKNDGHCIDPIVYGDNLLRDPGFELHDAYMPKGPNGEEFVGEFGFATQQPTDATWYEGYYINYYNDRDSWWEQFQIAWDNIYRSRDPRGREVLSENPPATTNRYADAPVPAWLVDSNNGRNPPGPFPASYPVLDIHILPRWFISDSEPDVNSKKHARIIFPADANFNAAGLETDLYPIGFEMCRFTYEFPETNPPSSLNESLKASIKTKGFWSAKVRPGDTVTFTARVKASWDADPGNALVTPQLELTAYIWKEALFKTGPIETESTYISALGTSYKTYTLEFTIAEGPERYLGLSILPYIDGPPGEFQVTTCTLDVDNCTLSIEPGPGNAALGHIRSPVFEVSDPNYEIGVRFEGQVLKGYAAIHHVEKKVAPEHVVLS